MVGTGGLGLFDENASTSAEGSESIRQRVGFPVAAYVLVALVLLIVGWFSYRVLDPYAFYGSGYYSFPGDAVLGGWLRYDGDWYQSIVRRGYYYDGPNAQSSIAFFPAYPLAFWVVGAAIGDKVLAAMIVTATCGLIATVLLYRWACKHVSVSVARLGVVLLVAYPYAWYLFGAVYADALFLAAAIGAFVLLENDHPVLAGLCGAIATAARPIGLAVVLGLVAVTIVKRGGLRNWRELKPSDGGVLLSAGGLVAWSGYLWWRFGSPLLFNEVQGAPGWDQGTGPHTWFKVKLAGGLVHLPGNLIDSINGTVVHGDRPWSSATYTMGTFFQGLMVLGGLVLVPVIWKRLNPGYAIYVGAIVAIAIVGTKDFQGAGRYMLAAFPCFVVGALLLEGRRRWTVATVTCSAALLILLTSAFTRGYYVA